MSSRNSSNSPEEGEDVEDEQEPASQIEVIKRAGEAALIWLRVAAELLKL